MAPVGKQSKKAFRPRAGMTAGLCLTASLCGSTFVSHVEAADNGPQVFSAIEENDYFNLPWTAHTDRHYTQGLKFVYLDGSVEAPWWAKGMGLSMANKGLPSLWMDTQAVNYGMTFGQNIYTPENNLTTALITTDRPYAGWMYLGTVLQRQGLVGGNIPVLESFELDMGVVGPEAQGGRSQNEVHQLQQIPQFGGWGNQIKTEPAFVLKYGRAWEFTINEATSRYFDIIPNVGADLGTLMVSGNVGATARLGFNLPGDFGVQMIDSPIVLSNGKNHGPIGFYIFGQGEGHAVGRNLFLDGNTYKTSFHVTKKPLVADLIYGVALTAGPHFEASWTLDERTLEFVGQRGYDRFGSVSAKFKWEF
jgi:hypothetical protein